MADNKPMVLYVGEYDDVNVALDDLDAFEQLHENEVVGDYDAAVVDMEDGKPHIVKRADHPRIRAIAEAFGGGPLPRNELHEAARSLRAGEAGLVVVGEPMIAKGFEKAVTRAANVAKREFDAATGTLDKELAEALRK